MGAGAGKHPKTPVESMGAGLNEVKGTLSKDTSQPEKIQQQQKKINVHVAKTDVYFYFSPCLHLRRKLVSASTPPPPKPHTPSTL